MATLDSKEAMELQAHKVPKAYEESRVIRVHPVSPALPDLKVREDSWVNVVRMVHQESKETLVLQVLPVMWVALEREDLLELLELPAVLEQPVHEDHLDRLASLGRQEFKVPQAGWA